MNESEIGKALSGETRVVRGFILVTGFFSLMIDDHLGITPHFPPAIIIEWITG